MEFEAVCGMVWAFRKCGALIGLFNIQMTTALRKNQTHRNEWIAKFALFFNKDCHKFNIFSSFFYVTAKSVIILSVRQGHYLFVDPQCSK